MRRQSDRKAPRNEQVDDLHGIPEVLGIHLGYAAQHVRILPLPKSEHVEELLMDGGELGSQQPREVFEVSIHNGTWIPRSSRDVCFGSRSTEIAVRIRRRYSVPGRYALCGYVEGRARGTNVASVETTGWTRLDVTPRILSPSGPMPRAKISRPSGMWSVPAKRSQIARW